MYLKRGLSAAQVAERLGISKTAVLEKLHSLGIQGDASVGERMTNPKNYRASVVPYGYRKVDGQLVTNKKEMRICRLVVSACRWRGAVIAWNRQRVDVTQYQKLQRQRMGDHSMVRGILKRWHGKI